ncbi:D-alanine--D-alanine ligase [Curtobacterium sp. MCPF17_002]|uniref:D-alanine--D-alanine ligase family protein n=1 Tax=Curtobacterium sp. MCPF17_002 TaxID=2175645 RepID=UPI000DA6E2F5|nr:D-alanine--D-alanine ligase [Curtobacterium sp. MCPF17_002]WIB75936.1 D-alanine--D-alanine ligase [Curtobacterium sp. MCPF17_002]
MPDHDSPDLGRAELPRADLGGAELRHTDLRRVAVIGGGVNDEHEVSLASAAAVARAVHELGLDVVPLTIDRDGSWRHTDGAALCPAEAVALLTTCDAAFPALHGVHGEDGTVAGFLDLIGVPVVGSPVRAGALGMDKWVTKTIAESLGISTAPAALIRAGATAGALPFAPPLVVKPTTGGSSNGVSVVRHTGEYPAAIASARAAGPEVLVESFVTGREIDIAVFRDRSGALRTGSTLEIGVADGALFGREQKYDGTAEFVLPARLTDDEHAAVERAARTLYDTLGCAGVARFDFFVTADGVVLNEVNTCPGFTKQSQVPQMFAAVGLPYVALVRELLDAAVTLTP